MIVQILVWHIIFSTLCGTMLALIFQGLNSWIAVIALAAGTVLSYACRFLLSEAGFERQMRWDWIDRIVVAFIVLIGLRQFGYLFFSADGAVQTLNKNNLGDLPLHVTYMRHMVDATVFPPGNPYFSLEKLRYPLGMDFYNALWEQIGVTTQAHLFVVGIVMLAAAVMAMYRFGGILVVGAFFLNGGLAGWQVFATGALKNYQEMLAWKNFFLSLFITQRGLLMALPLGLWLVQHFRERFYRPADNVKPWSPGQVVLVGVSWGALALFHMHSFIVVSLLIAFYTLVGKTPKNNLRQLLPVLVWAVPLGTLFVLYLTDMFGRGSMVHFQWSWFAPKKLLYFLGVELGPWTLFLIAAAAFRVWRGDGRDRAEWLMAVGGFLLFNGVLLAPWEWDKLKVLIWFYLLMAALGAKAVNPYLTHWRKAALCFVLFFSGTVCLLAVSGGQARPTRLYEWRDLCNTKGAVVDLPRDAVVAATPTFNHPLSFWGYTIAMGYSGHLWSHGVQFQGVEAQLWQLYQSGEDWARIAAELHLTHIFWGPMERARFGDKTPVWREILPNLSTVQGYELYAIVPR